MEKSKRIWWLFIAILPFQSLRNSNKDKNLMQSIFAMKKTVFLFIIWFLILSCKKNNHENPILDDSNQVPNSIHPTGLIPATVEELSTVKSIKTLDTSRIRVFSSLSDVSIIIDGLPDAGDQVYGSCMSWALGYYVMSYYYRKINGYPDLLLSPSFIYNQTAKKPPEGGSFVEVLNFAKQNGTCTWSHMSGNPTNFLDKPSPEAIKNAQNFTISDFFKFESDEFPAPTMKTYLKRKIPILIAVAIDEAWQASYKKNSDYILSSDGSYTWRKMNNYKNSIKDYHAVTVCGFSNVFNAFLIKNSWGKDWGQNGYMWIDYGVFEKVVKEFYLAIPRFVNTDHVDGGRINITASGNIENYGFFEVKTKGFCYSTEPGPVIDDPKDLKVVASSGGEGTYTLPLQGLKANKTYYIRAYATDSKTYYGNEESFTTEDAINVPNILGTYSGRATWTNHDGTGQDPMVDLVWYIDSVDQNNNVYGWMTIAPNGISGAGSVTGKATGNIGGSNISFGWSMPANAPFKYKGVISADKRIIEGTGGADSYYAPLRTNGPFKLIKE